MELARALKRNMYIYKVEKVRCIRRIIYFQGHIIGFSLRSLKKLSDWFLAIHLLKGKRSSKQAILSGKQ